MSIVLEVSLEDPSFEVSEMDGEVNVCILTGNQSLSRNITLFLSTSADTATG